MKKYLQENGKKILAVMGVLLMIAWFLPNKNGQGRGMGQRLVGYAGDQKIYDTDLSRAKQQWMFLNEVIFLSPESTGGQEIPLGIWLRQRDPSFNLLAQQVSAHPEMFYLLQLEADRMGVMVTTAQIDAMFKQMSLVVRLSTSTRPIVEFDDVTDPDYKNAAREALAAALRVRWALTQALGTVKVSRPMREHDMQDQLQKIQLACVMFSANDFLAQVAPANSEQLKAQFDQFSEYEPGSLSSVKNPHGFGYKHPNRVKLQYIGVRQEDVKQAVRAMNSDYDWDVEARRHYQKHQSDFPSTAPAPMPATNPASQPAAAAAAATTRPFTEVRQQIIETLMAPDIKKKTRDAQDMIKSRLTTDWNTFKTDHADMTAMPTTAPATTQPAPAEGYASYAYLQKLAADVQRQTGVLPVIAAVNQDQTAKDLETLPNISEANFNGFPFSRYATELAADVVPPEDRQNPSVLKLYQPSQPVTDATGSFYIFRLTSALAKSKPASIVEVADAVARDFKIARAYDMAKERADKLLDSAIQHGSLARAVEGSSMKLITTGLFDQSTPVIDKLDLDAKATQRFSEQAFGLLTSAATQPSVPPMKQIELPEQMRIDVVQLLAAVPMREVANMPALDAQAQEELLQRDSMPILQDWYNFDSVVQRLKWKDEADHTRKS